MLRPCRLVTAGGRSASGHYREAQEAFDCRTCRTCGIDLEQNNRFLEPPELMGPASERKPARRFLP